MRTLSKWGLLLACVYISASLVNGKLEVPERKKVKSPLFEIEDARDVLRRAREKINVDIDQKENQNEVEDKKAKLKRIAKLVNENAKTRPQFPQNYPVGEGMVELSGKSASILNQPTGNDVQKPPDVDDITKEIRNKLSSVSELYLKKDGPTPAYSAPAVPVGDQQCPPCPVTEDFAKSALIYFWGDNLLAANGCACASLRTKIDDFDTRIARSIYVATFKYAQSVCSYLQNSVVDLTAFQSTSAPAVLQHWEVWAPFPYSAYGGDTLISQMRQLNRMNSENLTEDVILLFLRSSMAWRFVSELADGGLVTRTSIRSMVADGKVEIRLPLHMQSVAFQGWATGVTYVTKPGPHVVTCKGVHTVYIRNDNLTRITVGDLNLESQTEASSGMQTMASIELKVGPVGVVLPLQGSGATRFSCAIYDMNSYKISLGDAVGDVQEGASTDTISHGRKGGSEKISGWASSRSHHKSTPVIVIQSPMHISDAILNYPLTSPNIGNTLLKEDSNQLKYAQFHKFQTENNPRSGKGLLLSGKFSLPIFNADIRSVGVRFEVERSLLYNLSIRVMRSEVNDNAASEVQYETVAASKGLDELPGKKPDESRGRGMYREQTSTGFDHGETSFELFPGRVNLIPLELYSTIGDSNADQEVFLVCKNSAGALVATVSMVIIPARGPKQSTALEFPCRFLNESLTFSFIDRTGGVSEATFVAPILPLPSTGDNENDPLTKRKSHHENQFKAEMSATGFKNPNGGIVSIRGKGVASRGSRSVATSAQTRSSEAGKKYESMMKADAAYYSSSVAARMLAEGISAVPLSTAPSISGLANTDSVLDRKETVATNRKSQFYVHRARDNGDLVPDMYIQYLHSGERAYLASNFQHFEVDGHFYKFGDLSFPLLISLQGGNSHPREQANLFYSQHTDPSLNGAAAIGVEGYWILVPGRKRESSVFGISNIEFAVNALERLVSRLDHLPRVEIASGRILLGVSSGSNEAVLTALSSPDSVTCVAAFSLQHCGSRSLASLTDASGYHYVPENSLDPALRSILTRVHLAHEVDRFVNNAIFMNFLLRSGSKDIGSVWNSKKMHRILYETYLSSADSKIESRSFTSDSILSLHAIEDRLRIDIVKGHERSWNHTSRLGDGGMLNDEFMVDYYDMCRQHAQSDFLQMSIALCPLERTYQSCINAFRSSSPRQDPEINELNANNSTSLNRNLYSTNDSSKIKKCSLSRFSMIVYNPAVQNGMCGFRILQQVISLGESKVEVEVGTFSRRDLLLAAVKEIGSWEKKRSRSTDELDELEPNEDDIIYFDALSHAKVVDGSEMERNWMDAQSRTFRDEKYLVDATADDIGIKRTVREKLTSHPAMEGLFTLPSYVRIASLCIVRTSNVRRLRLNSLLRNACRSNHTLLEPEIIPTLLIVDGIIIKPNTLGYNGFSVMIEMVHPKLELCFSVRDALVKSRGAKIVSICEVPIDPLLEKSLGSSGPILSVFSKPLVIVYGTPSHLDLRMALRDFAVYFAAILLSARGIIAHVFSDLEFKDFLNSDGLTGVELNSLTGNENIVFVGDVESNKVIRGLFFGASEMDRIQANLPVRFFSRSKSGSSSSYHHGKYRSPGFSLGPHRFDESEDSVVFVFPIVRFLNAPEAESTTGQKSVVRPILGLCIAANSLTGYLDMSQLFWSNIIKSLDGPSDFLLPDYVVISSDVWSKGISAGIELAGDWNSSWGYDSKHSYIKPGHRSP